MKLLASILSLVVLSAPTIAEETDNSPKSAITWLNQLSHSLNFRNFSTSFVVVKNNQAVPYHWFHGIDENSQKLEILSLLNGPTRNILRKGDTISYIEPELPPYSVSSAKLSGPIPSIFSENISKISEHYDFVIGGRNRVLGRSAQLVRISAKDEYRNDHWLWLDQSTSLLLKMAIFTKKGQLLEQIQFTHLDITEQPSESIRQLGLKELPKTLDIPEGSQKQKLPWKVNWLPEGFEVISSNMHRISASSQPVQFMLFSDGLVDISVYVNPSENKQRMVDFVMDGATVALNQVNSGVEVSVVGKVPSITAKKIADSITFPKAIN